MTEVMAQSGIDIDAIREQFPVLNQEVNGKPLVYFDNAATSQKPQCVIDALDHYYLMDNSNIHRGAHTLAARATTAYEDTREALQKFINARESAEIIFTSGTTESINLVASSFGRAFLETGDEVIISVMEHHSNIVPWQLICQEKGATLRFIPVDDKGQLDIAAYENLLSDKTKIVSVVHASNMLGTINPIKEITQKAHAVGAKVLFDGAQAAPHLELDVQDIDCDFYALSAHKMYGPTGVGILYGKREMLDAMPPYMGGGEMIKKVSLEGTTFNEIPHKFEAGTPNIADVIAFKTAIDFINEYGKEHIAAHEKALLKHAHARLSDIPGYRAVGTAHDKVSVLSFVIEGVHPFDLGMFLDAKGIAIRTGHHCTQPLMDRFQLEGTARASFAVYNTPEEVDYFVNSVQSALKVLQQ